MMESPKRRAPRGCGGGDDAQGPRWVVHRIVFLLGFSES